MSLWKSTIERLPNLVKYLIIAGVIVFISFLFPNNFTFKYEFDKGQKWRYEDLRAGFDFAVRRPAEELKVEQNKVRLDYSPYYELDPDVEKMSQKAFEVTFNQHLEEVKKQGQFADVAAKPKRYLDYGKNYLKRLYSRGVVQLADEHQKAASDFVINVIIGNTNHPQTLGNLLLVKDAKSTLTDSLPYSRLAEPEFLLPILENSIIPNIRYNDTLTNKLLDEEMGQIALYKGRVSKGDLIVTRGSFITDDIYWKLWSYKDKYEREVTNKQSYYGILGGYFLLTILIIGIFLVYVKLFAKEVFAKFNKLFFILLWLVSYSYLVYAIEELGILSTYIIPFCIVPIVIKTFFNERLALFTHLSLILLASFISSLGYEFTFLQIIAGIAVLLSRVDTRDWTRFFYSLSTIFVVYALGYIGLSLIQEGQFSDVDWRVVSWLLVSTFLTLLAYPLIPLLERLFGFTSSITLVELSDTNRPLLRRMAEEAPGTLQHSLQVANLCEAAARKIGADHLLVKAAALYHDIGKLKQPEYFIENQSGTNPHEALAYTESAKIIIGHVAEGVKMAKKARLPKVIINFIKTHHGTTRAEYFYRNYLKEHPDAEVDEQLFRYPGPRPRTKEESIMMMADSIEAACKSLKNPTGEDLENLINKIINGKAQNGQFEQSELTFQEMEVCKSVFKQMMKSVHHGRIKYPEEEREV
jgi:putative nucleotidyltransferase with HDIG domain